MAQTFDIGVLVITMRCEADAAWEAVEDRGMDEDEESLSYEFVEAEEVYL